MFDEEDDEYNGNFNEDLEAFEKFLNGEEIGFLDSDKLESILDHYLITGSYTKAIVCADRGLEHFPFNAIFKLRKAQAISAIGRLKEGLSLLAEIEKMEELSYEFFLTKASIFSQLKDSKNAIKYFREAIKVSEPEDRDEIYLDIAMEYENLNDFQNAIDVLLLSIKQNPQNEGAIYELAFCYDQIGDYEKAIDSYSNFIEENPYSFTAWYNLGNAYSKLENWEKAVWAFDYCLLINPEFSHALFNLGNAYLSLEEYRKGAECFLKCMEIDGDDGLAFCYLAECHENLQELDLAREYYLRSIEMIPALAEAWVGLGIVLDMEDKHLDAIKHVEKAIDLDPSNAGYYHVLAGIYTKLLDTDKTEECLLISLELDPENEDALLDYYSLLKEQGRMVEIKELVEKYPTGTKIDLFIRLLSIDLCLLHGERERAIDLLIQCIAEDASKANDLFLINENLKNDTEVCSLFL